MKSTFLLLPLLALGVFFTLILPGSSQIKKPETLNAALMKAAREGDAAMVKSLLDQGAKVNARDKEGGTALFYALPHEKVLRLLLEKGADPNTTLTGERQGDMSFPKGMTLLMFAAMMNRPVQVQLLLERGARIEAKDETGATALHWTATTSLPDLKGDKASRRILLALIGRGADVNLADKHGRTPLIYAADMLNTEAITVLLEQGAKINEKDKRGKTALLSAVERAITSPVSDSKHLTVIKLLIDRGAKRDSTDPDIKAAIEWAKSVERDDIAALLTTGEIPLPKSRRLPSPPVPLLTRAKQILKARFQYGWRTNQEVLVLREESRGEDVWYRHDVRTGTEKKETRLKGDRNVAIDFSLDGKWALSNTFSERITFKAVALDRAASIQRQVSRGIQERTSPTESSAANWRWMPDSRRWLWLMTARDENANESLDLLVYSLDAPKLVREVKVTFQRTPGTFRESFLPVVLLGVTPTGRVLSWSGIESSHATESVNLFEFGIAQRATTARKVSVTLPTKAQAVPFLSPQGDQVAWILFVEGEAKARIELWISQLDGSKMRGIGYLEEDYQTTRLKMDSLQWTPDGKRVSFLYRDALYWVPVE